MIHLDFEIDKLKNPLYFDETVVDSKGKLIAFPSETNEEFLRRKNSRQVLNTFTVEGNLDTVQVDHRNQRNSCYFDGNSFAKLPQVSIGTSDFRIQSIFRPDTIGEERGILGSYGYRLIFRQDPRANTVSFWAHFPSSNNPQRVVFEVDPETWTKQEHYFGVVRNGNTFTVMLDQETKLMEAKHEYWNYIPFLGAYYDKMYAFRGYIRQYRLDINITDSESIQYTTDSLF